MRPIQTFQVGLKAFVWHQRQLLVVQENNTAARWELPGGRIDADELDRPLADVLRRELTEELGAGFGCTIGSSLACWIRGTAPRRTLPVFLTAFLCSDPVGEIVLSDEHRAWRWITPEQLDQLEFADGYRAAIDSVLTRLAWPVAAAAASTTNVTSDSRR